MVRPCRVALGVVAIFSLASCPTYSPMLSDCKVMCSDKGLCPAGLTCKNMFCRPANAEGSCSCVSGATQTCGGGKGECKPGQQTCTMLGSWGPCLGETKATPEICDNKDNDCNGTIDDFPTDPPACPLVYGVCAGHSPACVNGTYESTCDAATYGADYEVLETRCDGLDNDCDGQIDGTPPVALTLPITNYMVTGSDSGFAVVGDFGTAGGHQVALFPLNLSLRPSGAMVNVSPQRVGQQNLSARMQGAITYVAWADDAVDAGVALSSVDQAGTVIQYPPYPLAEATGKLSLAVNGTKAMVTFPAHFGNVVRLLTWDLLDGGVSAKDYATLPDGGAHAFNRYSVARLSPTGKALGWVGVENDGGIFPDGGRSEDVSVSFVKELAGARSSTVAFSSSFELVEVGNTVQSAWSYSNYLNIPFFNIDESGITYRGDVYSPAAATNPKVSTDHTLYGSGAIGRGANNAVLAWTEKKLVAVIATPIASGTQVRQRTLPSGDGGFFFNLQLAASSNPSTIAVTWADGPTGAALITGMLVCQP